MTALVTPFHDGEVDWGRMDQLVDRQVEGGADWLVPCGTTGESPTLTDAEHERLVETVIARAAGRCSVCPGTGSNDTSKAIRMSRHAARAGAKAILVVTPYYNRPTQEGLFRHYAKIAEAVELPIVVYNVPIRTGVNLTNDTLIRLRERFSNIAALKHATGSVDGVTELRSKCDLAVLSGDDQLTWSLMALGAVGVVSVLSNLCPALMKTLVSAARDGDVRTGLQIHAKVYDIAVGIGRFGPNPLPIKTAMALNGWLEEEFRLPLCPLDENARTGVVDVLRRHELGLTSRR
jgi:4-hydroxy-tetrahydrodipicolinate synthase